MNVFIQADTKPVMAKPLPYPREKIIWQLMPEVCRVLFLFAQVQMGLTRAENTGSLPFVRALKNGNEMKMN